MSKRVKLQVASACTAALMVGCMIASSASVFAIVGENNPGRGSTEQESTMVQGRDEVAVQREQIERWRQELEQLRARVSEKMDESMRYYHQMFDEAKADLERDHETEIALQAQIEKEPNNVSLIRELEFVRNMHRLMNREAFVVTIGKWVIDYQNECMRHNTEITNMTIELLTHFQTGVNRLIASARELEQCRRNLEGRSNDINLVTNLRQYEQMVSTRRSDTQRDFECAKNYYQELIRQFEERIRLMEQQKQEIEKHYMDMKQSLITFYEQKIAAEQGGRTPQDINDNV